MQSELGSVLRTDPFSASFHGESWRTQSWLVELGYGRLYESFEFRWVPVWLLVLGIVVLCAVAIRSYGRSRSVTKAAVVAIGLSWMGVAYLVPRPVIVSFAGLAVLVLASERRRLGWTVPLIVWIWAASHGSFVLGIGYLVLNAARRRERRSLVQAGGAVLVSTLTAHGYHVWWILGDFLGSRRALEVMTEWATPDLVSPLNAPLLLALVAIMVGLSLQQVPLKSLWIIVPFLIFGLTSTRAVFPALLVLAPWAVWQGDTKLRSDTPSAPLPAASAVAALIVALPFFVNPPHGEMSKTRFPIDAAGHLTEEPAFHDDVVGGYLILVDEHRRVFVDDRAELYGRDFFDQVIDAEAGKPAWRDLFRTHRLKQALLRNSDGLASVLVAEDWRTAFQDDEFIVLVKP